MPLLAEIMSNSDFAEIMFLVAFILFLIEVVRLVAMGAGNRTDAPGWGYSWILIVAGLACISLGWLALPTEVATP